MIPILVLIVVMDAVAILFAIYGLGMAKGWWR